MKEKGDKNKTEELLPIKRYLFLLNVLRSPFSIVKACMYFTNLKVLQHGSWFYFNLFMVSNNYLLCIHWCIWYHQNTVPPCHLWIWDSVLPSNYQNARYKVITTLMTLNKCKIICNEAHIISICFVIRSCFTAIRSRRCVLVYFSSVLLHCEIWSQQI